MHPLLDSPNEVPLMILENLKYSHSLDPSPIPNAYFSALYRLYTAMLDLSPPPAFSAIYGITSSRLFTSVFYPSSPTQLSMTLRCLLHCLFLVLPPDFYSNTQPKLSSNDGGTKATRAPRTGSSATRRKPSGDGGNSAPFTFSPYAPMMFDAKKSGPRRSSAPVPPSTVFTGGGDKAPASKIRPSGSSSKARGRSDSNSGNRRSSTTDSSFSPYAPMMFNASASSSSNKSSITKQSRARRSSAPTPPATAAAAPLSGSVLPPNGKENAGEVTASNNGGREGPTLEQCLVLPVGLAPVDGLVSLLLKQKGAPDISEDNGGGMDRGAVVGEEKTGTSNNISSTSNSSSDTATVPPTITAAVLPSSTGTKRKPEGAAGEDYTNLAFEQYVALPGELAPVDGLDSQSKERVEGKEKGVSNGQAAEEVESGGGGGGGGDRGDHGMVDDRVIISSFSFNVGAVRYSYLSLVTVLQLSGTVCCFSPLALTTPDNT